MSAQAKSLYFTGPEAIEIKPEMLPRPGPGQVLVKTEISAISAGTEMLIYRDEFPVDLALDEGIAALAGEFRYPLKYGYAAVGRVVEANADVAQEWLERRVFAFQPHSSHFIIDASSLMAVPDDIPSESAVFLPNMETAVNFLMDGSPIIGERVVLFGQGVVGLLTTALLASFPHGGLVALDQYPMRRRASLDAGADICLDPSEPGCLENLTRLTGGGADLVFELSGSPAALDMAIQAAGFASRIIIGSWYGQKRASLDLGGRFHRQRIRLISSQVTTIAPDLSGRWSKRRRFDLCWEQLRKIQPARWITHRFELAKAAEAFQLIARNPAETLQVVLLYES